MVSGMAAPLVQAGAKIGVLLGTAYLFTREAVETGAIMPAFQSEAVECRTTALLESGPATRRDVHAHHSRRRLKQNARGLPRPVLRPTKRAERWKSLVSGACGSRLRASHPSTADPISQSEYKLTRRSNGPAVCTCSGNWQRCARKPVRSGTSSDVSAGACAFGWLCCDIPDAARNAARPSDVAIVGVATLMPKAPDARQFLGKHISQGGRDHGNSVTSLRLAAIL